MVSNLVIGYPDIPARAAIATSAEGSHGSSQKYNVAYGPREPGFWLEDRTTDDMIFEHATGAADPYNYFAITDAKYLKEGGVTTVVLQTGTNPFFPATLASLEAWYDAGRGVTRDSSNLVSQWNDLSGNGYHLTASGSERPTWTAHSSSYNYNSAIVFNGTANAMRADALAALFDGDDSPMTVIAGMQMNSPAGPTGNLCGVTREAASNPQMLFETPAGGDIRINRRDDAGMSASRTYAAASAYTSIGFVFSGTNCTIYLSGSSVSSGAMNVDTLTLDRFTVGARRTGGAYSNFFDGQLSELAIFSTELTGADLSSALGYFNYRHGTAPIYATTGLASATLTGPRADHLLTTSISGTGLSRWYVRMGTSTNSRYRHSKQFLGSYLDLGRDPLWGRRSELISDAAHQKRRRYKYELKWEGLTLANSQTFISTIAEKADSTIFLLLTRGGYDHTLCDDECVPVVLTEYSVEPLAHNTYALSTTWQEAI